METYSWERVKCAVVMARNSAPREKCMHTRPVPGTRGRNSPKGFLVEIYLGTRYPVTRVPGTAAVHRLLHPTHKGIK
eukprot:2665403-Rhodomonas_salina.1